MHEKHLMPYNHLSDTFHALFMEIPRESIHTFPTTIPYSSKISINSSSHSPYYNPITFINDISAKVSRLLWVNLSSKPDHRYAQQVGRYIIFG
jgi:hypothetical protein